MDNVWKSPNVQRKLWTQEFLQCCNVYSVFAVSTTSQNEIIFWPKSVKVRYGTPMNILNKRCNATDNCTSQTYILLKIKPARTLNKNIETKSEMIQN